MLMKIGQFNDLKVSRVVDFGAYLTDDSGATEVLLPARYITSPLNPGDTLHVFVYRDSEDRPVAVTEIPLATVGEFAFLKVKSVNRIGAFLDWGLPKDLLVPFSEQRSRMDEGGVYPVYVYLDHATSRIAASAKLNKFLDNVIPIYRVGQRVEALVWRRTPIGYACIVDNRHSGMIYDSSLYSDLKIGDRLSCSVSRVRPDGKIDLIPGGDARDRTQAVACRILSRLADLGGVLDLSDNSAPEEISSAFGCSKKVFKKAIGYLLKEQKVAINDHSAIVSGPKIAEM